MGSVGADGCSSTGTGGDSVVVTTAATAMGGGRGAESKRMETEQEFFGRWLDFLSGHGDLVRF